jgi:hypothetical protein
LFEGALSPKPFGHLHHPAFEQFYSGIHEFSGAKFHYPFGPRFLPDLMDLMNAQKSRRKVFRT